MASPMLGQEGSIYFEELRYLASRGIGPNMWHVYYFTQEMPTSPM